MVDRRKTVRRLVVAVPAALALVAGVVTVPSLGTSAGIGRQGKLQFEVPRADMESMLQHAGKAYNGSVTLIWDPQI